MRWNRDGRPEVSIIVPSHDREEILRGCLTHLHENVRGVSFEVIVIDNASSDGSVAMVREHFPRVRLASLDRNLGAASRNIAIGMARGRFVAMFDDDSYPAEGAIPGAIDILRKDRTRAIGAIALNIHRADGSYETAGIYTSFTGCGAVFPREVFDRVGGYPEDFLWYAEEYDVSCRIAGAGLRVLNPRELEVIHIKAGIGRDFNRIMFQLVRNNMLLWTRYLPADLAAAQIETELWRYERIARKEGVLDGYTRGVDAGREVSAPYATDRSHEIGRDAADRMLAGPSIRRAVADLCARARRGDILIFNVGKVLHRAIEEVRRQGLRVAGIVDDNRFMVGDTFRGIPIFPRARLLEGDYDGILLGSTALSLNDLFERELAGLELRAPIVRLCEYDRIDGAPRRPRRGGRRAPALRSTERVRISTGLACNARCAFCYYNGELNTQSYAPEEVERMLEIARSYGMRDIDFSGGEPTIRRDLPRWLARAKDLGFRRICAITNGIRAADRAYLARLAGAGLNEILVSIHGASAAEHDALVGKTGAFERARRTVGNARDLGLRLRINSVVTQRNVRSVPAIANLVLRASPAAFNLILFNDWVNARRLARGLAVRHAEAAPLLEEAIDRLAPIVPKVTVRYIPFCFLEGLERHVCGLLQNEYDEDEWNDAVKRLITDVNTPRLDAYFDRLNDAWRTRRSEIEPILPPEAVALLDGPRRESLFRDFPPDLAIAAHRIENHLKRSSYVKAPCCRRCSRDAICDGLEPAYAEVIGTGELRPIEGSPIEDPMAFRRDYLAGRAARIPAACGSEGGKR